VLEPVTGYLLLARKLLDCGREFAEPWNFGPADGDARPVSWIADEIMRAWGGSARWKRAGGRHPHEAFLLKLDCSKARARLGWAPRTDLRTALEWIVEWYKEYERKGDMRGITEDQIARFSSLGLA
jgi:CDP-glucose 4,6-dehydratase